MAHERGQSEERKTRFRTGKKPDIQKVVYMQNKLVEKSERNTWSLTTE